MAVELCLGEKGACLPAACRQHFVDTGFALLYQGKEPVDVGACLGSVTDVLCDLGQVCTLRDSGPGKG